jgi:Restriction endonuclease
LPPSYDELPEPPLSKRATDRPSATVLQSLVDAFYSLYSIPPQKRGFAFERFLMDVFNAWHLDARGSFRNTGEQIDGSFWYDGNPYLLEAKWHRDLTGATTLHGFEGKVRERHDWTRGLFVSYAGFSPEGLQAFTARRVILMDGCDLYQMLMRGLPLGRVIDAKWRHAAERKEAFARVVELFPVDASG